MIDPGLEGKVVLVTGGNNPYGIGAATASAFAAQGASVFIHYCRTERDVTSSAADTAPDTPGLPLYYAMQARSAEEVVEAIRHKGGRAESWEANLADPAVVPELFERAERQFGSVDVLVNNAADYLADTFVPGDSEAEEGGELWSGGPVTTAISVQTHDRHFAVNTRAVALMTAEFARRYTVCKKRWGRIVNVSADCSWGSPGEVSYRASKYALESYSRSAAAELGSLGITVNVVAPGPVQTGYIAPSLEAELVKSIPLGCVGRPEDVADVIVFLASEQARWVTGQVLTVHGGHRMAPGL